jgi:hypothetical protein
MNGLILAILVLLIFYGRQLLALLILIPIYLYEILFCHPKRRCPKCHFWTSIREHSQYWLNGERWFCMICLNSYNLDYETKNKSDYFEKPERII